jgi:hypothetical protein
LKTFSITILLLVLGSITVFAQDTVKSKAPANIHNPYRPEFKDMFLSPRQLQKKHAYQDSIIELTRPPEAKHPILYADFGFGASFGLQGNYSLNYQYNQSLFTFRGLGVEAFEAKPANKTHLNLFQYRTTSSLGQYALLYGWRFTNNRNHAFSFSAGISADDRTFYHYYTTSQPTDKMESEYAGIPFEANYQWYGRRFGASFGLKLSGDISQHSFIGFGIDMGLGFHTRSNGGKNTNGQN